MNEDPSAIENILFVKLYQAPLDAWIDALEEVDFFIDLETTTMTINDMMEAELRYGPRKLV